MPSLRTWVKSLETIDLFPPLCKAPSIFCPTHPVPIVVTPWIYGERVRIQVRLSAGPHPGSKDTYDPPRGF